MDIFACTLHIDDQHAVAYLNGEIDMTLRRSVALMRSVWAVPQGGLHLSVRELLDQLAGIEETVLP